MHANPPPIRSHDTCKASTCSSGNRPNQRRRRPNIAVIPGLIVLIAFANKCGADEQITEPDTDSKPSFASNVAPFLEQYCCRCHGESKQNAERRFDTLASVIHNDSDLVDYQDILDQLNLSAMPPADEFQPDDADRRLVIAWLTESIADFHKTRSNTGGETILRRLNSREYRNTIRDLFHLQTIMFDPAQGFPRDQSVEHLDNIGETLVTSGYLLEQYLAAA